VTLDAVTLETHPVCRSQPKTITRSVTLTPVCDALDAGDDDAGSSNCRR
jgi:hypothetical protein